ncbi:hypothetical protein BCV72DRAFT_218371, partial [Rhizopus microsporus var. microsporus]
MVDRLNDEQRRVFSCLTTDMATAGNLYFVFGAAGTGKSFLLKVLSAFFEQQGVKSVVLAPTGVASYTAGGQTIHRFFGLTLNEDIYNPTRLEDFFKSHERTVLMIDEVSMVSAALLERLSRCLC